MIPQREDEHVTTGLTFLTEQFKDAANVRAILRSYLGRIHELEDQTWDMLWAWTLDYAEGLQLDDVGAIVGQFREGRSDDDYRDAIRLRTRINRSKGRSSDMTDVLLMLDPTAGYREAPPLGWEATIYDIPNGGDIIRLVAQAKAASSYGVLVTSSWDAAEVWTFGDDFPSAYGGGSAKLLPCALPTNPLYQIYT
jgi:hypothetical protein